MRSSQGVNQGVRSGLWSSSKCTNLTPFNPWRSLIYSAKSHWKDEVEEEVNPPFIHVAKQSPEFIIPFSEKDIQDILAKIPNVFLKDLKAIITLSGSKKIEQIIRSFYYGTYSSNWIFLAPYPIIRMDWSWSRGGLKPSYQTEYKRAGARVEECKGGTRVLFDKVSLKRFYLQDTLMHEIGHHVDRYYKGNHREKENFAEWFAMEYGYRLINHPPPE